MRAYFSSCFLFMFLLALPFGVQADSLGEAAIEAYIDSLGPVRQLGEKLQAEGKQSFLEREITPRNGELFDPHTRGVKALQRESTADYSELGRIVRQYGFTSAESWALTGDRVVLAYGAIKAEAESPEILQLAQQMQGMDPQMLQLMPPEMRQQMEQAVSIARTLAQVPAADKQSVRPYTAQLDRIFSQP
jgi:hypothetical protein